MNMNHCLKGFLAIALMAGMSSVAFGEEKKDHMNPKAPSVSDKKISDINGSNVSQASPSQVGPVESPKNSSDTEHTSPSMDSSQGHPGEASWNRESGIYQPPGAASKESENNLSSPGNATPGSSIQDTKDSSKKEQDPNVSPFSRKFKKK